MGFTCPADSLTRSPHLPVPSETALASHSHGRGFGGGVTEIYFDYDVQAGEFDAASAAITTNVTKPAMHVARRTMSRARSATQSIM